MQVYKTTTVKATEADFGEPEAPLSPDAETALANDAEGFFTPAEAPIEAAPLPTNPFDLLFSQALPSAAAAAGAESNPASPNFSADKIPTLQNWLMAHPEGRFFLDKFILKMETVRDNSLVRMKQELEARVRAGGLSPSDVIATQKKIEELSAAILTINQEIQKAQALMSVNQENFEQEKIHMKDLNGDGYVGDPTDKKNSFIVGRHPNGKEVLLNAETKKPAVNPYLDPEYMPAVVSTEKLSLLNKEDQETVDEDGTVHPKVGELAADAYLQIKDPSGDGYPATDISAQEGFWVRKNKNGKPQYDKDDSYIPKKFETVVREGGKEMIGQKPPTEDEKEKWMFIQATDLKIFSADTGKMDNLGNPIDGGDVYFEFKDKTRMIARFRVQGMETSEGLRTSSTSSNYTAATTMGVAVNAGSGAHSSRLHPMNVDASGFQSTGVVSEDPWALGHYGHSTLMDLIKETKDADAIINEGVLTEKLKTMKSSFIRTSDENALETLKFGVTITGIRGLITGTNANDVIVVPPPDDEKIKELLPVGAQEIDPSHGAYGTYVNGGGGDNIVVSKGGDLYADGVTFLWREAVEGQTGDQIWVRANNSEHDNYNVEVYIKDPNPEAVKIYNGQDGDENNVKGVDDDVYEVPANAKFAMEQNDLPGGFSGNRIDANLGNDMENSLSEGAEKIKKEAIYADPLAEVEGAEAVEWEFGAAYDEWDKQSESFFGEWDFFKDGTQTELDTDLGTDPGEDIDEDVTL